MSLPLSLTDSFLIAVVFFAGGAISGVTGFGYGLVCLTALSILLDPQTAVILMIIPIIAADFALLRELDQDGVQRCGHRFRVFILAAAIGTLVGMVLLPEIQTNVLTLGIGGIVLFYVLARFAAPMVINQNHAEFLKLTPNTRTQTIVGFLGGVVFGGTSLGIMLVTYLDSLDLDRSTFTGAVGLIFVGISVLRVPTAWVLGLYDASGLFLLSTGAAIPGILGVTSGRHLRRALPKRVVELGVYALLMIIGTRLILQGLNGL